MKLPPSLYNTLLSLAAGSMNGTLFAQHSMPLATNGNGKVPKYSAKTFAQLVERGLARCCGQHFEPTADGWAIVAGTSAEDKGEQS